MVEVASEDGLGTGGARGRSTVFLAVETRPALPLACGRWLDCKSGLQTMRHSRGVALPNVRCCDPSWNKVLWLCFWSALVLCPNTLRVVGC